MFLRCSKRRKDGKEHLYWSVVENRRLPDQRIVQRHVLYLGELNGVQESSWRKTVELFGQDEDAPRQVALFPEEHAPAQVGVEEFPIVRVRLSQMALRRPRQWGACWLGCQLWEQLGLGEFWRDKLTASREGTRWDQVLQTLVLYRLIDPGSEWRLHRHWFDHTALADLLGGSLRSRKSIASTNATTNSWRTKRPSSIISPRAGATSSPRSSRCSSTI